MFEYLMEEVVNELERFRAKAEIQAKNKDVIALYWNEKWNKRCEESLDKLQTRDVIYHGTSMELNGIEEYKQAYRTFLSALHDTQLSIEDLIAESDKVMSRVTCHFVHMGDLEGIPPTGKSGTITLFTVFRLVNGRIAEEWEMIDELGLMTQLGMELKPKNSGE